MKNIILLGAPGSGKGTQSEHLIKEYGFHHLSTGDIIRKNIHDNTEYGQLCKKYSEEGKLVPDDIMIAMVEDHLKNLQGSIIWDGFPRTINQAQKLDELLAKLGRKINHTLYFEIDESKIIARITGRRICPKCGKTYHLTALPPKQAGLCDFDGSTLIQRADDSADKITVRLVAYHKDTAPLVAYYLHQQNLTVIDADMTGNAVWDQIVAVLK
ncbi:adenylate kinase [Spiroplasma chrysopicola]|uniref:Adenylate kinase n=1 Tax=Spiroplasma chrysopicola DF-1 TaxID=1276227 RepID=R4UF92_9MOLU|nr:adenylate kinase [Spiroplasma chrysopicola]AGM24800.1 adenylate kinase [Spiroplasma chrysopicola DF-1]